MLHTIQIRIFKLTFFFTLVAFFGFTMGCSCGGETGDKRASYFDDDGGIGFNDDKVPTGLKVPPEDDSPIDWGPAIRLDNNGGTHPKIKMSPSGNLEVTWFEPNDPGSATGNLVFTEITNAGSLMRTPEEVTKNAFFTDWLHPFDNDQIFMVASGKGNTFFLEKANEDSAWLLLDFIPNADSGCEGNLPVVLSDYDPGAEWDPHIFFGYEQNVGNKECKEKTHHSQYIDSFFDTQLIGNGHPSDVLVLNEHILVATPQASYIQENESSNWERVSDHTGPPKRSHAVMGTSLINYREERLLLANPYILDDVRGIELLIGDTDGSSWIRNDLDILWTSHMVLEPRLGVIEGSVVAATWLEAHPESTWFGLEGMRGHYDISFDGGKTWPHFHPGNCTPAIEDRNQVVAALEMATWPSSMAVIYQMENMETGESLGIYLRVGTLKDWPIE